jgi:pyrroline-5-carboxylate reductase
MKNSTIAVIGCGNMGASLIGGLIADGFNPAKIWATGTNDAKLAVLQKQFGINVTADNNKAAAAATVIILSVKPQKMAHVCQEIADTVQQHKPLVLSVATGVRANTMEHWLGSNTAIVRCMPNTPALIGCGASGLYANKHTTSAQRNTAESIMRAVGIVVWLDEEKLIDSVTALSGSGPAYFFLFMELMQEVGEKMGLSPDTSRLLTLQTGFGATRMALESSEQLATLRQKVTSPNGTTEQALKAFEKNNLRKIVSEALEAAHNRAGELADLMDTAENKNA